MDQDERDALLARVADLEARLAALEGSQVGTLAHEPGPVDGPGVGSTANWTRRALLLGGVGAAVGAAASVGGATPAAASGAMIYGAINNALGQFTTLRNDHAEFNFVGYNTTTGAAIVGQGTDGFGVVAASTRGPALRVYPEMAGIPPGDAHTVGSVAMLTSGELWVCVAAGTPGTWRMLASPASTGAYVPIAPVRVYDSRLLTPDRGARVFQNGNRVISVRDSRDPITGAVRDANIVPQGTVAVTVNLTVADVTGAGYLGVSLGNALTFTSSVINWNGDGQNLANGLTLPLDVNREIKVWARNGSAHVIVDVTGYFRGS